MTPTPPQEGPVRPLWWNADVPPHGALEMIDQTRLPAEYLVLTCTTVESVWKAIKRLSVRGAPAIGVSAAYGVLVGMNEFTPNDENWPELLQKTCDYLATSRPTAVNLFWALDRMRAKAMTLGRCGWPQAREALLNEAHRIREEDAAMCHAIGANGQHVVPEGGGILTHCNAGSLATSEYGTALAVMYAAHERGRRFKAYVDETRPLLQGARLTAWELMAAGIDATLICDNMAAVVMKEGKVDVVVTGADRVAGNGDAANKIGTYGVAVLAAAHEIPFYIAAPSSTFDHSLANGDDIPIEYRDPEEVRQAIDRPIAPAEMPCYTPAFDVTPAELITGLITEKGVISPVTTENIRAVLHVA